MSIFKSDPKSAKIGHKSASTPLDSKEVKTLCLGKELLGLS